MSEPPAGSFGSLLRSLRVAAGLTQEELAEAARVSYRSISDLERGVSRSPRRDTARLLAGALGLSGEDRARFEAAARGRLHAGGTMTAAASSGGIAAATRMLPRDIASFTGREPEIESIVSAVTGAGGVVDICAIGGMAGIGKTALAVHAAHRLAGRFPDGQIFLQLHGHTPGHQPVDPADALASLLQASGIPAQHIPDGLEPRAGLWRDRMAGRRMLLVLDNAAASGQVAPLLPGDRECLVLVTSRRHLGDLPGTVTPVPLDVLPPQLAAQMFTRLAPRAAESPGGLGEVAEVVRLAGYLPLAISLLARLYTRHPSWTLADLATETRASLLTLTAEHESIAAAFETSYRHLDPDRQRFFSLLGLHPGTAIDPYAAAALAGTGLTEATRLLDSLHGEGLLTETGHRRYTMHDLLRRYARNHAAVLPGSEDSSQQALERLLDYYQHTAARADTLIAFQTKPGPPPTAPPGLLAIPHLDNADQALAWARAERTSLLACLDEVTRTGQHARVVALTASIAGLLRRDGPFPDAISRHTAAAQAASHVGDRLGQANALNHLGVLQWRRGDFQSGTQDLGQALEIYRDLGDRLGQANALKFLGATLQLRGDLQGGTQAPEQALEIYRDLGDRYGQANALMYLGIARRKIEDYPGAAQALEQALEIYRHLGIRVSEAVTLNECGTLHRARGEFTKAEECYLEALELARTISSSWDEAHALAGLGRCAMDNGHTSQAGHLLRQALEIFQRIGAAEAGDLLDEVNTLTRRQPAR